MLVIIPFDAKTKSFRNKIKFINPLKPHLESEIEALWDTGAATSTIPEYCAYLLNLTNMGKILIIGNNGGGCQSRYWAECELGGRKIQIVPNSNNLNFALIGMDIISKGELWIMNMNGNLTMFFYFV